MKKVPVLPFMLSLSPVLITFLISLTSWMSADATHNPAIPVSSAITSDTQAVIHQFDVNTLPLAVPADAVPQLETLKDNELQAKLEAILRSNSKWAALAKNKTLNIGIVDMHDPLNARFAAINGNNMVYAASLPKIAVLLAGQEAIEQG